MASKIGTDCVAKAGLNQLAGRVSGGLNRLRNVLRKIQADMAPMLESLGLTTPPLSWEVVWEDEKMRLTLEVRRIEGKQRIAVCRYDVKCDDDGNPEYDDDPDTGRREYQYEPVATEVVGLECAEREYIALAYPHVEKFIAGLQQCMAELGAGMEKFCEGKETDGTP